MLKQVPTFSLFIVGALWLGQKEKDCRGREKHKDGNTTEELQRQSWSTLVEPR